VTATLRLHDLHPSPNNAKVRIALGYKGLAYERVPFEPDAYPGDRSALVAASRQPLTPVLEHGDTVVFDSSAILRYLEANFPDTPPLFSTDYATMHRIEEWELFARTDLGPGIGLVFRQAIAPVPDGDAVRRGNELVRAGTERLEAQLAETPFLAGDALSAADVAAAPVVQLAALEPEDAAGSPIRGFFREHLRLGEGRERTREWVRRVLAFDR